MDLSEITFRQRMNYTGPQMKFDPNVGDIFDLCGEYVDTDKRMWEYLVDREKLTKSLGRASLHGNTYLLCLFNNTVFLIVLYGDKKATGREDRKLVHSEVHVWF